MYICDISPWLFSVIETCCILCEARAEAEEKADLVMIFVPWSILNIAIYEVSRKILYLAI
jgi:hypothetical protein